MRIDFKQKTPPNIDFGDVFVCYDSEGDKRIFLLVDGGNSASSTGCSLVDLGRNFLYHPELNHINHAVNHLNKHFTEVTHIKSGNVELTITH